MRLFVPALWEKDWDGAIESADPVGQFLLETQKKAASGMLRERLNGKK